MIKVTHYRFSRIVTYAVILALFLSIFQALVIKTVHAQEPNLISNASVETPLQPDNNVPELWFQGGWGDNTATYQYKTTGQNGTRSLNVNISAYTDGDAKWYFEPVAVQPNVKYYYSDYYKSSLDTDIYAQYEDASLNYTYQYLGTAVPSTTWKQSGFYVTPPTNTTKMTVFHILSGIGSLDTDNFSLRKASAYTVTNGVPNNSVEQTDDVNTRSPLGWYQGGWGDNTRTFSYVNSGYNGSAHAIRVSISAYTDGDAKWYFEPQAVTGGKDYVFSDYYKSNTTSYLVALLTDSAGNTTYKTVSTIDSSPGVWAKASTVISVPQNIVSMSVMHLISGVGSLTTDEFSLTQFTPIGFNQGMVSINFDDGWASIHENGLPLLQKYGIKSTQYIVSGFLGTANYMTVNQVKDFQNNGDELASHSVSHQDLTKLTAQQLATELKQSKSTLEGFFGAGTIKDFASPYGTYNKKTITAAKRFYQSYRTTDEGYIYKNDIDVYKIKTQNVTNTTTVADVERWIDEAKANKAWLVIVYHEVNTTGNQYSTTPSDLDKHLEYIKNSGIQTATMDQARSMVLPQL